jgi:hypothetical protein
VSFAGYSSAYLIAAAVIVVIVVAVIVFLVRRARPSQQQALPSRAAPSSPTAVVCQFCNREYEPSETGGRCPGCGAATPRKR